MAPVEVTARLLEIFKENGLTDLACINVTLGESGSALATPAEEEFFGILRGE